jgi:hypothetical protein
MVATRRTWPTSSLTSTFELWARRSTTSDTAAGFLLKIGDHGLTHVATDRSMTAALASQDPLTVGASGRIVTHTLMSSGHLQAAITTARNHAVRVAREIGIKTPESLSVYGSVLLRAAVAAAQADQRGTAHEMLAEAANAARRVGTDANLRGTAFGPVNTAMHQVNVAVTLGDAGSAIDPARQINLGAITVTERKATLLIDMARAFFQLGQIRTGPHRVPRRGRHRPAGGCGPGPPSEAWPPWLQRASAGTPSSSPAGSAHHSDPRRPGPDDRGLRRRPGSRDQHLRQAGPGPRLGGPGHRHPGSARVLRRDSHRGPDRPTSTRSQAPRDP